MQPIRTPCQRLAWAIALAAVGFAFPSSAFSLPPPGKRVDFSKHGGDWVQGNCASRAKQSPIDLNEIFKPPSADFHYMYSEVTGEQIEVSNDGRMLSATLVGGGLSRTGGIALDIGGAPTWFNLTSINIKSESEHTLRGKHFPLEIQLVHKPAHFYVQGSGPAAVTVSVFVECENPPKAKQVYPGLLQKATRPSQPSPARKLRGDRSASLLQQDPSISLPPAQAEESEAFLPEPAGPDVDDPVDEDPAHLRMNGEVNFVRTLVEGEDALDAGAPAPAIAAGPAGPGAPAGPPEPIYVVPSSSAPDFNPLLQFLVEQEPPDLDSSVETGLGPTTPLRLNALLAGGTYFYYAGSDTLPPCGERELWLIKREVVRASTEQVTALYSTVHLMSGGAGNFRTSMPYNDRVVQVLAGQEGIPRILLPSTPAHEVVSGKEQKYIDVAKDAITIAKAAADYAKDIDWRIQAASTAHLKAMEAADATTAPPTTSAYIPKPPEDQVWATKIMSDVVKKGIHEAMEANIKEMIPATASLATSYLRQRILKKAGYGPPPLDAKIVSPQPIPGVPTFFPPVVQEVPEQTMADVADVLDSAGCNEASNFTGCGNVSGLSASDAQYIAQHMSASSDDDDGDDEEEEPMTPEQIQALLPPGAQAVPADWPDADAWPSGVPPVTWPNGADPSVWPDPDSAKPAGMSDYQWERYQYNWQIYRSSYLPYRSSYTGYTINRRRRMSSYTTARRRRSYTSARRRSYTSSTRRRSYRSSARRRSYSSSARRRSWR